MDNENIDFVLDFFAKKDELPFSDKTYDFEQLESPIYPSKQFSAVAFLYGKLKNKKNKYFLHGEHDELFIGSFSDFENFTLGELKEVACYGVGISEGEDGFRIYASM